MTSELRPAEELAYEVWEFLQNEGDNKNASGAIKADREAVRAYWYRQGKDDGWQCREEQAAELAKFKALAETQAREIERLRGGFFLIATGGFNAKQCRQIAREGMAGAALAGDSHD